MSSSRGILVDRPERFVVNTPYGQLEIAPGDWVVTDADGERYPVKQNLFKLAYERSGGGIERIDRWMGRSGVFWLQVTAIVAFLAFWCWYAWGMIKLVAQ